MCVYGQHALSISPNSKCGLRSSSSLSHLNKPIIKNYSRERLLRRDNKSPEIKEYFGMAKSPSKISLNSRAMCTNIYSRDTINDRAPVFINQLPTLIQDRSSSKLELRNNGC